MARRRAAYDDGLRLRRTTASACWWRTCWLRLLSVWCSPYRHSLARMPRACPHDGLSRQRVRPVLMPRYAEVCTYFHARGV